MLQLLLWILITYFGYHLIKGFLSRDTQPPVRGKSSNPPLDLNDENVEDAKFKDVEEK